MKNRYLHLAAIAMMLLFLCNTAIAQKPVSFTYYQSMIFVRAKINNSSNSYTFLINTGANKTVLDKRLTSLLRLPLLREDDIVEGTAGKEDISACQTKNIAIGASSVKGMEVACRDLSEFISIKGQKVDGILGTDFLKHFAYTIDFPGKKITFTNKKLAVGKLKSMPFTMGEGIPRVEVTLDDKVKTQLHYNSGVGMAADHKAFINVSSNQWQEVKRVNPYINATNSFTGKGVGGDLNMMTARIGKATINNVTVREPVLVIQSKDGYFEREDAIGFFGNNLLEKCQKVTIDFISGNIVLHDVKKPAGKSAPSKVKRTPSIAQK